MSEIKLEKSWLSVLKGEFDKDYMKSLRQFLLDEKKSGKTVYPPSNEIFAAFDHTPFDRVKVVILGQDPYHGPGQAHGLSFSVKKGVRTPPSLLNMYKELERDLGIPIADHGFLESWADQGVLLLNSVLTVVQATAGAHQKRGWEEFTDAAVSALNEGRENLVFMLWGSYAQKKGKVIDRNRHLVLTSPHPSPLSAHRGFIGNGHFSKANAYLEQHHKTPINWSVNN
ncbi:uracil-DNA glycosylase [Sneathiella sp. P13V-1]|uniref:uracil-DNA glycosylase n=1 Tax=Sneathiella sp. P13V-1 TaxID=2697366 RepID=UPI00187BAAD7|nr:uracil-DNA glycosylase [Sneathiella sp. P13V-1]MBE7637254.1 uracil-DNA glycosylase [Sneathiella sp. P13V-1]